MEIIKKINSKFGENKILYFMVFIFFTVGMAVGCYMVKYMGANDINDLSGYFTSFTKSILSTEVNNGALFFSILKKNAILILLIIILGFTTYGTPFVLIIDSIKGFTLGYTFSFLLTTFSGKGIWLAIASLVPCNIIYIPCFIALSIISLEFSSTKLRDKFFNKGKVNTIVEREVILKIGVFICIFILGIFIEAYICPGLMKMIVTKVYKAV